MGSIATGSRKIADLSVLICAVVIIAFPLGGQALAQNDAPTDRPFPVQAAETAVPQATDRPFPVQAAETAAPRATDRPFPVQPAKTAAPASTESVVAATATDEASLEPAAATAEQTASLTIDNALATAVAAQSQADQLLAQNKTLQDQLASAQADKGATLYAGVIVVIGILLAFAIFFGLRRSKE